MGRCTRYSRSMSNSAGAESTQEQLAALRHEYAELERSLPRHSVKPSQILRLEALEDEIAELEALLGSDDQGTASSGTTTS
jgi:hypothetical protein